MDDNAAEPHSDFTIIAFSIRVILIAGSEPGPSNRMEKFLLDA